MDALALQQHQDAAVPPPVPLATLLGSSSSQTLLPTGDGAVSSPTHTSDDPEGTTAQQVRLAQETRALYRWSAVLVTIIMVIGMIGTVLLHQQLQQDRLAQVQNTHDAACARQATLVREALHVEELILAAIQLGVKWVNGTVDRDLFVQDVQIIDSRAEVGGTQLHAFVAAVPAGQRDDFEAGGQAMHSPGFRIHDGNISQAAPARAIHYPAFVLDREGDADAELGLDYASIDERVRAIELARDNNKPSVSRRTPQRITAAGPQDAPPYAVLMCLPIFRPKASILLQSDRVDAFIGVAGVLLDLERMFTALHDSDDIELLVFDTSASQLLYSTNAEIDTDMPLPAVSEDTPLGLGIATQRFLVEIGDSTWTLLCQPVVAAPRVSYIGLVVGLLVSIVLALLVYVALARSLSLHSLVTARTGGLEHANELLRDKVSLQTQVQQAVQQEAQKNEILLHSILPATVCQRLKDNEYPVAHRFDSATIVFIDLVGFTPLSATMEPFALVRLLNEIFSIMDAQLRVHHMEKIKTIGDAYMAVCGVPDPVDHHAVWAVRFALAVKRAIQMWNSTDGRSIHVRIGVNTGPIVAGVIGSTRFQYDVWGDAVNLASRMESTSEPNRVQISATTYAALHTACEQRSFRLHTERRGMVEVKGKGLIETYYVSKLEYQDEAVSQVQSAATPLPSDAAAREAVPSWVAAAAASAPSSVATAPPSISAAAPASVGASTTDRPAGTTDRSAGTAAD